MAHFEDLTRYTYQEGFGPNYVNIGWMSGQFPLHRGLVRYEFAHALKQLCETPINLCRGVHICEFCSPPEDMIGLDQNYRQIWAMGRNGNGEIHVLGLNGRVYVAPALIFHYVVEHQYQPPEEFILAVEDWWKTKDQSKR